MANAKLSVVDGGTSDQGSVDSKLTIDPAAEDAVIANVLIEPCVLDEVRGFLKPEHFFSGRCAIIYRIACELRDAGQPIDNVTVASVLRDQGRLAQVGGPAGLTEIVNAAPGYGPTQVVAYAKLVRDRWARRALIEESQRTISRANRDEASVDEIVTDGRTRIDTIADALIDTEHGSGVREVMARTVKRIDAASQTSGKGSRPTGFDRLDRLTAGLHPELVLLGARPGMGKTSLATAIAVNRAMAGEGAYIASLETSDCDLMMRIVCAHARIELQRCRTGMLTQTDWSKLMQASVEFAALPLWVDDQSGMTVADLWTRARRIGTHLARKGGKLGIVVVDYIQLLRAPRANMKREEVIAENARTLKAMAHELDCPVLALAQLNRDCERRPDKRPQLADLRESGELEQCARTVLLLYREDYYTKPQTPEQANNLAEVNVAKQNNGPSGMVRLRFDGQYVRFENLADGYE